MFNSKPETARMRYPLFALATCGLLVAVGCGRKAAPASAPLGPVSAAARIYYDNGGGIQDSLRLVIRNPQELQKWWGQATSRQQDPPPIPTVDWEREMLLVAAAGPMTPEGRIRVDSVGVRREMTASGRMQDVLTAVVRVSEGCRRFNTAAYPVEIVRVRRFSGAVSWTNRRETTGNCERA